MRFSNEDGYWTLVWKTPGGNEAFIEVINHWNHIWGVLTGKYKLWYLEPLKLEVEWDRMFDSWEASAILLGLGLRFRINGDWSKHPEGRKVMDAMNEIWKDDNE